jgi:hypothetical protein
MQVKKKSMGSSQDSSDQPPQKKAKLSNSADLGSSMQSNDASSDSLSNFSFLQTQKTTKDPLLKKIIVKKGDSIKKRIDGLLKELQLGGERKEGDDKQRQVLLMGSGDGIQKLLSIIEIVKSKLTELPQVQFEQFNKLDKYETVVKKNEILDKKVKVPVFYSLIRVFPQGEKFIESTEKVDDLKNWTRNE